MLRLTIQTGPNVVDYSQYVEWHSIQIQEQINVPAIMTFNLDQIDWTFRVPVERAYVQLYSTINGKSLFTGFISIAPTKEYIALADCAMFMLPATGDVLAYQGGQMLQYQCTATSDEYLLNLKAVPFIPAFINRYQGDILAALANLLCPGFFDTTQIALGDLVPFFSYTPTQDWSQIAKQFGDASRYRYKVRDRRIWYQPYGDDFLGISYDEALPQTWFDPTALQTTVMQIPAVNDVIVIGDAEAGGNHEDYYCGDGFTANLPLHHKVFNGASVLLLQESWNNQDLNLQQWYLQDPGSNFDFSAGALNVITSPSLAFGANGLSYLAMNNGLELAGGLNLQHGEVTFGQTTDGYCAGVIGGLYTDESYATTSYLGGFNISSPGGVTTSASGAAGVVIQPAWNGQNVGQPVVTQVNHTYVLQTLIHAPKYTRWAQVYRTIDGEEYGGGSFTVTGSVTFNIQDYDIGMATGFYYIPQIYQSTVNEVPLPDFAAYALINNDALNISLTNTTIAKMPLGGLSGLLGACGLYSPSGLVLPMLQTQWWWGIPPSGNYLDQPMPAVPFPGIINLNPTGNQYYVGGVSTFSAVAASGVPPTSTQTINVQLDAFTSGWHDYGPGFSIVPATITYGQGVAGYGGLELNINEANANQVAADFDLIKNFSSPVTLNVTGSTDPGSDTFTVYFKQDQPIQAGLIVALTDAGGHTTSYAWSFQPVTGLGAWNALTAARTAFSNYAAFDWSNVTSVEFYNDAPFPSGLFFTAPQISTWQVNNGVAIQQPDGTTTYGYVVQSNYPAPNGVATPIGVTRQGAATLTRNTYNAIVVNPFAGASLYYFYRVQGGSFGLIGSSTNTWFNDTGMAGNGAAPPAPPLSSMNIWIAGAGFSAQTVATGTPLTNYISLLLDPLFNVAPGPGEVVGSWVNAGSTSVAASWTPPPGGDPNAANSGAVTFSGGSFSLTGAGGGGSGPGSSLNGSISGSAGASGALMTLTLL